jgi:hypothetical protein
MARYERKEESAKAAREKEFIRVLDDAGKDVGKARCKLMLKCTYSSYSVRLLKSLHAHLTTSRADCEVVTHAYRVEN